MGWREEEGREGELNGGRDWVIRRGGDSGAFFFVLVLLGFTSTMVFRGRKVLSNSTDFLGRRGRGCLVGFILYRPSSVFGAGGSLFGEGGKGGGENYDECIYDYMKFLSISMKNADCRMKE